ncbi:MAG: L,D-transpeptidase [Candidatus Aenigmarchaeota archaeon]|nr:L,D-transpeptidase [Candidatus Aenigmarchaeota archaeon]
MRILRKVVPYIAGIAAAAEIALSADAVQHGIIKDKYGREVKATQEEQSNYKAWTNEIIDASKSGIPQILVNKAERTLTVYRDGKSVHTYPIALGNGCPDLSAKQETAPQEAQRNSIRYRNGGTSNPGIVSLIEDSCTPEGVYNIVSKNNSGWSYYTKTLGINYPNGNDVNEAYMNSKMSRGEWLEWIFKGLFGDSPLTALGMTEGILGHSNNKADKTFGDWTRYGEIGLDDDDMNELFSAAQVGKTKIGIVRYLK